MDPSLSDPQARLEPKSGCGIAGILKGVVGTRNTLPIVHGSLSCSSGYRMIPLLAEKEPVVPTTAVGDKELVVGTEVKLEAALHKALKVYKPRMITVILTCATSMIGEHYEQIAKRVEQESGVEIVIIDGSGLVGSEEDGFYAYYTAVTERVKRLETRARDGNSTVNIAGLSEVDYCGRETLQALKGYIESVSASTVENSMFIDFDLDEERAITKNRTLLPVGNLWNMQGTQEERIPGPFGAEGTYRWLTWMANRLNVDVPAHYYSLYLESKEKMKKIYPYTQDARVAIESDGWWGIGVARFLTEELGCRVALFTDESGSAYNRNNPVSEQCYCDVGGFEMNMIAEEFAPAIGMGSSNLNQNAWHWIPFSQPIWHVVDTKRSFIGFDGAEQLAAEIRKTERESA